MSLDTMTLWPFWYTLRCQPRDDLDPSLGSLPDHSLYIGSSNNVSQRLCFHFQDDSHGTQFTKRFQPLGVDKLCVQRPVASYRNETHNCRAASLSRYHSGFVTLERAPIYLLRRSQY